MSTETIEKTFTVPSPAHLTLVNIRGSVQILVGAAGAIQVNAAKRNGSGDARRTEIILEQRGDGRVVVETRFPDWPGWFFFYPQPCQVDYVVHVPARCDLRLSLVSSQASVTGLRGEIGINTVSGPLSLEALYGDLKVKTVSGGLRGRALSGPLDLDTVSAGAHLEACQISSLRAKSISGELFIETGLGSGPYRINSVSGNVYLSVPVGTGCTISSSSLSGRVLSNLATTHKESRPGWHRMEVLGGGAEIDHHSISGSLQLLVSEAAAEMDWPSEQGEEQDEAYPATRDVLERIAQGELSVEEGLRLLDA